MFTEPETEIFPEREHACATGVERILPPVKKTEPKTRTPKSATVSDLLNIIFLDMKNF